VKTAQRQTKLGILPRIPGFSARKTGIVAITTPFRRARRVNENRAQAGMNNLQARNGLVHRQAAE
jgi:hypothetical protein